MPSAALEESNTTDPQPVLTICWMVKMCFEKGDSMACMPCRGREQVVAMAHG